MDVSANLSNAQIFLGLASASERTCSEANKTRVIAAVNARGDGFLRGLERYRTTPERLESNDQKITALQNYFDFGQKNLSFFIFANSSFERNVRRVSQDPTFGEQN